MTQPNWIRNLEVTKVALCGRGMNPEANITLFKAVAPTDSKEAPVADIDKSVELEARVAELEAERTELDNMTNEDLAVLRGIELATAEVVVDDDVLKGIPEDVRKRLEDAEATIAKMEQDNRAKAFLAKAKEFEAIAPAADLAPVLETLDRIAPEQAKALDQALKAATARIDSTDLFKEFGSSEANTDDPQAKAKALIEAEVEKGATRHDAMAKVFKDNPELLYPAPAA